MKIACISDTHSKHELVAKTRDWDECAVLVCAGDITWNGELAIVDAFAGWMGRQPQAHKVLIAGNHDWCFADNRRHAAIKLLEAAGIEYLEDSSTTIDGLKFYGSPWQPEFCNWAFNLPRGHHLRERWGLIPEDTDVLITHGPMNGVLDLVPRGERTGCWDLRGRVERLPQLRAHICGHIHCGYGTSGLPNGRSRPVCVNASICTEGYAPSNDPIVIDV